MLTVALISASPLLRDQVTRLAVAAGVEVVTATAAGEVGRLWSQSPLVLVGADAAGSLASPLRRAGVVLLDERDDEPALRLAVATGAERVAALPRDAAWLVERMAEAVEQGRPGTVVGVLGARGGVGVTVLVAGLGLTAVAAGLSCVLLDVDPVGDLPFVLDLAEQPGLRWPDLASAAGRMPSGDLGAALPRRDGVPVLGGGPGARADLAPATVHAVVPALARGHDLVVVDLPRVPHPAGLAALERCRVVLLVVPCDRRGVQAAGRLAVDLRHEAADVRVVARSVPGGGDARDVADELGLPLVARLRTDRRVHADAAVGVVRRRSSVARACRGLLADLATSVPR